MDTGDFRQPSQAEVEPKPTNPYPFLKLPEGTKEASLSKKQAQVLKATNAFIAFSYDTRHEISIANLDEKEGVENLLKIPGKYRAMQAIVDYPANLTTIIDEEILSYFDPTRELKKGDVPIEITKEDLKFIGVLQAKMQFAAHEFKNPLTIFPNRITMLLRKIDKISPDQNAIDTDKQLITESTGKLLKVINNLPDFFADPEKMLLLKPISSYYRLILQQIESVRDIRVIPDLVALEKSGNILFSDTIMGALVSNAIRNSVIEGATEIALGALMLEADKEQNLPERLALTFTDNGPSELSPMIEQHGFTLGESHHGTITIEPGDKAEMSNKGIGMANIRRIVQIAGGELTIAKRASLPDGTPQPGVVVTATFPRR